VKGRLVELFCHAMPCEGLAGVQIYEHPATMTDPAWLEYDACPHCGASLHAERLPWEDAADALLDTLEDAEALDFPKASVDRRALMEVVTAELERQSREHWRAEHAARQAAIDHEFPPAELLPF